MNNRKGDGQSRPTAVDADQCFDPITAALRQMHDDIANEPIPADFLALLDQIDAKMTALKKSS